MKLVLRPELPSDTAAIHRVNAAAFETDAEARLVDALRAAGALTLSLVAVAEPGATVVGHIAFSPVTVTREGEAGAAVSGIGLAPMAVLPEVQRRGVGTRLVEEGLKRLRSMGHRFCVVLGHPGFYPRFGFVPASRHGLRWEQPAADEAFQVLALSPGGLDGVAGVVRYRPELSGL